MNAGGVCLSPTITRHQLTKLATLFTEFVAWLIVVTTAQFLQSFENIGKIVINSSNISLEKVGNE